MKKETARKLKTMVCSWLDNVSNKTITGSQDLETLHCALGCLWKIFEIEHGEKMMGCELCDNEEPKAQNTDGNNTRTELKTMLEDADTKKLETLKKLMQVL